MERFHFYYIQIKDLLMNFRWYFTCPPIIFPWYYMLCPLSEVPQYFHCYKLLYVGPCSFSNIILYVHLPQMLSSSLVLYAMRCLEVISFSVGETQSTNYNPAKLVPKKTLVQTLPLAMSYLLYMVCISYLIDTTMKRPCFTKVISVSTRA